MKKIVTALALLAATISCGSDPEIHYNRSFEDISLIAKEKPFCIVLVDHMQYLSGEYAFILQEKHGGLAERAVYNIADIEAPGNEWYIKWLCPLSVPLTCVFSPEGRLVDLIPGMGEETFSNTGKALADMTATEYRWPNRFELDKARAVPVLNDVLQNRMFLSNGVFIKRQADAAIDSLSYPYSVWMKLSGQLMAGDTLSAKGTANDLLELGTPYNLNTYRTEFLTAHKIADPGFRIDNEPNIRVAETRIDLGELPMNRMTPVDITVYNDGGKPLNISGIIPDCSCLRKLGGEEPVVVAPRDSVLLPFALAPSAEGDTRQEVLLISDGINGPMLNIEILATFRTDL